LDALVYALKTPAAAMPGRRFGGFGLLGEVINAMAANGTNERHEIVTLTASVRS
jgi:hypothetical protein